MHPDIEHALYEQRVRRAVGRTIVRIGLAIEAEPRTPAASR